MKNEAVPSGKTIQQRLTQQSNAMLEEICTAFPQAVQADFETPVATTLALLQLDARKHCLYQRDALQLLFLQGVAHGLALGMERAGSQIKEGELQ